MKYITKKNFTTISTPLYQIFTFCPDTKESSHVKIVRKSVNIVGCEIIEAIY